MNRKKLLMSADGGCFTGFSRIAHTIIENLPEEDYEVHHLAINYRGDPFQTKPWHRLYPAALGGDLIGLNRINDLIKHIKPDVIFMINDLWLLNEFFDIISPEDRKKTVCYFPVDAFNTNPEWVRYLPEVHQAVAYTEFGKNEVNKILPYLKLDIIPHGIDTEKFYPAYKKEAVATLNGIYENDFIVLNANRNQPRKRIDLTIRAFAEFAKNKPSNVKLYLHMGVIDQGWNIIELSRRLGIEDRLLLTSTEISPVSGVSDSKLNEIYNACDIGINTCYLGNTSVLTKSGYKNIENIEIGETVFSHTGTKSKVTNTFKYNYSGEVLKITAYGSYPIELTPNHKLFADIRPYTRLLRRYKQDIINKPNLKFIKAEDLLEGSVLTFPVIKNETLSIGKEKAFIYGAYLAEGCPNNGGIVFSLNSKENDDYLRESIIKYMKNIYNLDAHISNHTRNRQTVNFYSAELKKEFINLFNKGAKNKQIPKELLSLTREDKISLLKAYFLGDGHLSQKSRTLTFTTISENLAKSTWFMLTTLGFIAPSLEHKKRGEWTIRVNGKSADELSKLFELKLRAISHQNRDKMWADNSYVYFPIKKIEHIKLNTEVFDLEVENEHSYVTHFAGHNSQGEGWGLPNFEHAATGKPQIVPNSSACAEIFKDMGLLIPILDSYDYPQTLTTGQIINVHEAAKLLNILYYDKPLRERLSKASLEYTHRSEFKWANIASRWDTLFKEVIQNNKNNINISDQISDQISLI